MPIATASLVLAAAAAALSAGVASADVPRADTQQVDQLLRGFAADYRNDPMAINSVFGIKVGEDWWTITVKRRQQPYSRDGKLTFHRLGPHEVTLTSGQPAAPTWYFDIASPDVLKSIAAGEINAGTAAMRSFGSDRVGVSMEAMDGFEIGPGAVADMYHAMNHFWTKGVPEVTYFERDKSLPTHGAAAVALHGYKDRRIAWFSIGPEEAANDDPRLESGQVPNLFIVTKGRGRAIIGERELELREGMSVFIPPYTRHVLKNPYEVPMEGILVLFGDNADFVRGTSYPEFLEDLNDFYRTYPFERK